MHGVKFHLPQKKKLLNLGNGFCIPPTCDPDDRDNGVGGVAAQRLWVGDD